MMKTNLLSVSRKKMIFIVLSIAFLQFILVILEFHFLKQSFSGDEVYSYATSNSCESMSPLVDMDGTLHINEWLTSDQLLHSVVVSENEILAYRHIDEILRDDAHPPLYFYMLHFFSSFFIGRFSWIPAIIINSVSIFIGQIFFYRLFLLISSNRFQSLLAMLFFGCTTAMVNMMTFARNYTLLTSFTVIFTFYIFKSMQQRSKGENPNRSVVLAALFLYLAALTQYLSVLFGFFVTLFVCIYYLIKKDYQFMLKSGLAMTASICLMILSFPHVIHQLTIDQTSMENAANYPYPLELRVSVFVLFNELFGIKTPVYSSMISFWIFWGIIAIIVIYSVIRFLFRTDSWFIHFQNTICDILKDTIKKAKNQMIFQYGSLLLAVTAMVLVISYKFKMYFYYPISNRYLFLLFPYVVILVLLPLFMLLRKSIFQIILVVGLSCLSLVAGKKTNIDTSEMSIKEATDTFYDSDVMVVVPNHYAVNSSLLYFEKSNQVFYTTQKTFYENKDWFIHGLSNDKPLYLMYYWSSYDNKTTKSDMDDLLVDLEKSGITTINDSPKNHGAKLIAGINGHVLIRLR